MNLILATVLLAGAQCGSSCGNRIVVRTPTSSYHATADYHETEIRYQRVLAVIPLLDLPSYSAYFLPPPPPPPPPGVAAAGAARGGRDPATLQVAGRPDKLDEILTLMRGLDSRVRVLEGGTPRPPPQLPAKPPAKGAGPGPAKSGAFAVFSTKCALCHEAKLAKEKGGGLVLLTAGGVALAPLTDKQKNRVLVMSYQGRMPPPDSGIAALTDQEVGAIVDEFSK